MFLRRSILAICVACLLAQGAIAWQGEHHPTTGILQGRLTIFSPPTVALGDGETPTVSPETYAEYPLVVLSADGKKQIATVTADAKGNFRVELPPGNYVLDVQNRVRKHVRANPVKFTVKAGETVQVGMNMDTGIR